MKARVPGSPKPNKHDIMVRTSRNVHQGEVKIVQRVTNCVLRKDGNVLLLQKPRRNWWVAPGGKMEPGESVKESVVREYREETGLTLTNPLLKGVFTIRNIEEGNVIHEWMMFTFVATEASGKQFPVSEEGILEVHREENISSLPMAEGDRFIFRHMLTGEGMLHGVFDYTPQFELLEVRLDPHIPIE